MFALIRRTFFRFFFIALIFYVFIIIIFLADNVLSLFFLLLRFFLDGLKADSSLLFLLLITKKLFRVDFLRLIIFLIKRLAGAVLPLLALFLTRAAILFIMAIFLFAFIS
jgi:hypothetical protein